MGYGTVFCGKRDFRADGTYLTTEWFMLSFVPVVPLRSWRVRDGDNTHTGKLVFYSYSQQYFIIEKRKLSLKQVLSVYMWFGAAIVVWGPIRAFIEEQVAPTHNLAVLLTIILFGTLALIPVLLRNNAKKHMWRARCP